MAQVKVLSVDTVYQNWGVNAPEWVKFLAEECDRSSQAKTAKKIKYSPAVVNLVLKNNYTGIYNNVKEAVNAHLMGKEIICPVLGKIELKDCIENQQAKFTTANPTKIKLFKACRSGCQNFKGGI
jgi:sRNA-binding carbon storage regulator CsrA